MPTHQYSMWQISIWILHWTVQHLRYHIPYIEPMAENAGPPEWWYHFYSDWDWWRLLGPGNVPYRSLIDMALRGTWRLIGLWVDEVGDWATSSAQDTVRGWLGYASAAYTTFSSWIWSISDIVGPYVPGWATNFTNAIDKLFGWLPTDIRDNIVTWYDKFVGWYNAANDWAALQFGAAKTWVANTAPGLVAGYNIVRAWYDKVSFWVGNFYDDPYGKITGYLGPIWFWLVDFGSNYYARITGWLGDPWSKLIAFTGGALTFFYNLWAWHAQEIADFWADPVGWLLDQAEEQARAHTERIARVMGRILEELIKWGWRHG